MTQVAVVGGGIAGLVAAHRLADACEVTVWEGSPRCGGKLATVDLDGVDIDTGAESMLARRPEAVALVRDIGLGAELVHPGPAQPAVFVGGRSHRLPPSVQGVPTNLAALADLLTADGWARAQQEPHLAAPPLNGDVAIGEFVEERFGAEVTDRLLEPLLGGVYAGRSRDLSFAAVAPELYDRARIGGALSTHAAGLHRPGSGPVFAGLAGGVGRLASTLVSELVTAGVDIRTGATVRELRRTRTGFVLRGPDSEEPTADAVVVACPAAPAGRLLSDIVPAAEEYAAIPYASTAVVSLAVRGARLAGSGLLVPPGELPTIKAMTHSSKKWDWVARRVADRWGEDVDLVRISVGRRGEEAPLQVDDRALTDRTVAEARALPGWSSAEVITSTVTRWGGGLPQYLVGHRALVGRFRADVAAVPGLAVCGAALDGVGITACIASAERAAAEVLAYFG